MGIGPSLATMRRNLCPARAGCMLGIGHFCPYDAHTMRIVADILYLLAGVLYLPIAVYNAVFLRKNRTGWRERFGGVTLRSPDRQRIWLHAVSLGEVNATPRLVEALCERLPDVDIVISTTTDTGYARAVTLYGGEAVFRFPLDFGFVISRVLRRIRPTMIVLVELEVWYNLVTMAHRRGVPVVVVNGRFTQRSARRLSRVGGWVRPMFRSLTWVGAQDEPIAARFKAAGVLPDRVEITASLKWDSAQVLDTVPGQVELAQAVGLENGDRPIWVAGSTGVGEEAIILDAYARLRVLLSDGVERDVQAQPGGGCPVPCPVLVIVPRKPERFDEVAGLIVSRGFACLRRSVCPDGEVRDPIPDGTVLLGDTMGELRRLYSLASVVFVGRSLVPMGGSDPIEVAALAKPVVVGPHTENFALPVSALSEAEAVRVVDGAQALALQIRDILADPALASAMGGRARQVVLDHQGATARTADRLVGILSGC